MKTTLIPALAFSLIAGPSILTAEPVPAPPSALAGIAKELRPTPESMASRFLSFMTGLRQTLAGVQNKAGADTAAKTLKMIHEEILKTNRLVLEQLNHGVLKQDELIAALDQIKQQGQEEKQSCIQEMLRLRKAACYGSSALAELLEKNPMFRDFLKAEKEPPPTASVLARQSVALMTGIRQTLADARNTESADKAAETLKNMQESVRHFQQSCCAVSSSEWEKFEAGQKRMKETAEKLVQDCKKEGSRLVETRYYGSAALKELLEDSKEFRHFIQPNEPDSEN